MMSTAVPGVGVKSALRVGSYSKNKLIPNIGRPSVPGRVSGIALNVGNREQHTCSVAHNGSRTRVLMQATSALEISQSTEAAGPTVVNWECGISSASPLLGDTANRLEIVIVDLHSDIRSSVNSVDSWLPPQLISRRDGTSGWSRDGPVTVPASLREPGAVLIRKLPSAPGQDSVDYIGGITLANSESAFYIPVESWVSSAHGWRVFFSGAACLPKDTPAWLVPERNRDLEQQQGTPETRVQERKGADRIYWYQTYNDLGTDKAPRPSLGGSKALPYPRRLASNRGNAPDGSELPCAKGEKPWLPYDEQFSFNKAAGFTGGKLSGALTAAFSVIGEIGNNPNLTLLNLVPTAIKGVVSTLLGLLPFVESPLQDFEDVDDVLAMFQLDADKAPGGLKALRPAALYPQDAARGLAPAATAAAAAAAAMPFKNADGAWDFRIKDRQQRAEMNKKIAESRVGPIYDSAAGVPTAGARRAKDTDAAPPEPGALSIAARLGEDLWNKVKAGSGDVNDLLYFYVPRVLEGRPDAWHTDEEYGRQILAGHNPVTVTALKQTPESLGSAIRGEHVNDELQGSTLEQLVADAAAGGKPRLFWQDYWALSAFWDEEGPVDAKAEKKAEKKGTARVEHQGRALYYLQKDEQGRDKALIPIAFELANRETHTLVPGLPSSAGVVYARSQLAHDPQTRAVWLLARAVFKSLDFSVHEVYSHFTRAHAAMEPFLIALRRNISTMHPVYKLMLPHFRYTLNINCNARTSLINANGIIEQAFTPGPYSMRLGAALYGAAWTFAGQALPADLKARGMLGPDGRPWLDYPFAADGLDLWAALSDYFDSYLRIYYKSDEDVLGDAELQAWWHEVKTEGHPDLVAFGIRTEEEVWGFTGPIPSVERLVSILTTIAWIGSGHHAAINFGQYDYTSFILNTSSLIRLPMPQPDKKDKAYKAIVEAPLGSPQEKLLMKYLADPLSAVKVMSTVQLLSSHAEDEQTLDERNTLLTDPAAVEANSAFRAAMRRLDVTILSRNADPANWARCNLPGPEDDSTAPLPYTLLAPSSGSGVTMRGVPYSVSI